MVPPRKAAVMHKEGAEALQGILQPDRRVYYYGTKKNGPASLGWDSLPFWSIACQGNPVRGYQPEP